MFLNSFIFFLIVTTITCNKIFFYFYIDDSITTIKVDNQILYNAPPTRFIEDFQYIGPYDITIGSHKQMEIILYNANQIWELIGYIEIDGFRIYTNNSNYFSCTNCSLLSFIYNKAYNRKDKKSINYIGYMGNSKIEYQDIYYQFIFKIPNSFTEMQTICNTFVIQNSANSQIFNLNHGENIEINTIYYIISNINQIDIGPYNNSDEIYFNFLSDFKGILSYKNGTPILNNGSYNETNFIFTPNGNFEECYKSSIEFYSYKKEIETPTSSKGILTFIVCIENCNYCGNNNSNYFECTQCKSGFYFVNGNKKKCINENYLKIGYYKIDNLNYYSCYETCLTCNTKGNENNNQCILCSNFYYKISDSNNDLNCVNICPSNYPFLKGKECSNSCDKLNLYYKNGNCVDTCYLYKRTKINNINEKVCIDTCEGSITLNYINNINECVENCPSTYNFKLIDGVKLCLKKKCNDNLYYQNGGCVNKCDNQYFYIKDTFECMSKCLYTHPYVIKNENNEKMCIQNCDEKIYIKNDVKYCVENCPENIYEYPKSDGKTYCVKNCPYNTYEYHNITENKKYCLDDCLNKFKYIKDNKKYCYNICPSEKYHYNDNNQKKCINICPIDKYEYIKDEKKYCYDDCLDKYEYIKDNKKYCYDNCLEKYEYFKDNKKYCYDNCYLINTIPDKKGKICYENCKDNNINENNIEFNNECVNKCPPLMEIINSKCVSLCDDINENKKFCNITKEKMIEEIFNNQNFYFFKELNKNIFFGYGFNIQIYENNNISFKINEISELYVDNCEKILRNKYKINDNENLYIIKVDSYEENIKENYNIEFYFYYKGKILDNYYCKNINYNVLIPINKNMNLKYALEIYKKYGIDIYNKNDNYFNDICNSINDGNNILFKEREKKYYHKKNLCINNCIYDKMDYEKRKSICKCNSNNEKIIKKNIVENFFFKKGFENIVIFKCYKKFKLSKKLFYNIGFDLLFSIILIQTLVLIFKSSEEYKKFVIKIYFNPNNNSQNSLISTQKSFINIHFISRNNNLFFQKDKYIIQKNLNIIPYKFAKKYDKRKFIIIFWDLIKRKIPFLNIFYQYKNFQLFFIDINKEFTCLVFLFLINTLLYNDKMILHKYEIGNKIDYFFLIKNSFRVYFIFLLFNLIRYFFNYSKFFDLLINENDYSLFYQSLIKNSLKKLKLKVILYFVLQFIFCILILYYVTVFCFIYNKNQIDWFIQGWFTFGNANIAIICLSLFISLIKKISFKIHSVKLYNMSLFIYNFKLY